MTDVDCLVSRRAVIGGLSATALAPFSVAVAGNEPRLRAIAFDAFPIFDPRPITALARRMVPEKGEALASAWTTKLFGSTWLMAAADRYQSFESLADGSLRFTAEHLGVTLTDTSRRELLSSYEKLDVWSDVKPVLTRLRAEGLRLAFLSNLGERALRANMANAGITDAFEFVLSTDKVRRFKPSPAAYRMAMDAFALSKEEIGFAAFGGWDAVGASWFGYRAAWINRLGMPVEPFEQRPAVTSRGLDGVLTLAALA